MSQYLWRQSSYNVTGLASVSFVAFLPGDTTTVVANTGNIPTTAWHEVDVRGSKKLLLGWAFKVESTTGTQTASGGAYGLRTVALGMTNYDSGFEPASKPAAVRAVVDYDAAQVQLDDNLLGFVNGTVTAGASQHYLYNNDSDAQFASTRFLGSGTTAAVADEYYTGSVILTHRVLNEEGTTVTGVPFNTEGIERVWIALLYQLPTLTAVYTSFVVSGGFWLTGVQR